MSKDGGHAFPQSLTINDNGNIVWGPQGGMSLRDWFAGMALNGMLASDSSVDRTKVNRQLWASIAYSFSDAMLAERSKS